MVWNLIFSRENLKSKRYVPSGSKQIIIVLQEPNIFYFLGGPYFRKLLSWQAMRNFIVLLRDIRKQAETSIFWFQTRLSQSRRMQLLFFLKLLLAGNEKVRQWMQSFCLALPDDKV